jgi:glycosyltransferase involved in cell wall biosynthesis
MQHLQSSIENPLISCIVPTYNSERYVAEALQSIVAQTYHPLEVIIADDGSTDNTLKIVRAFVSPLTPIRIVTQHTRGPAATRNMGIQAAAGEFLAFLDADDLWHPEKLTRQIAAFRTQPSLDICVTHIQMFWEDELQQEAAMFRSEPRTKPIPGFATTTLLARRSVFERIGMLNESLWFADATEWFIRASVAGITSALLPDVLTHHRMHSSNHTRRRREASTDEFLLLVKGVLDRRRMQRNKEA